MKILFPYMARWNSANMSRYYHLFRKIAEAGHAVIVIQPPARASEETNYIDFPMEVHPNLTLHTVRIAPWLWRIKLPLDKFLKKALYTAAAYFLVRRLIRAEHPDVLVLYNLPQYIYTVKSGIPVVFDYADDYRAMLNHELGISDDHIVSRFSDRLLRRLIAHAVLVTSVSQLLLEKVHHPNKFLLPNGADLSVAAPAETSLHIDREKPVIGYVGAFEYFIDLDLIVETATRVPHCTFLLVGAGREFQRIKELVAEKKLQNVILTGAVPHRQAMQFISEMDLCLNLFEKGPVSDAASPIKLFEYMVKGKPVITTRVTEICRIDPDGQIFYYADTLAEVCAAVDAVLKDVATRSTKIQRGLAPVRESYTWTSLAQRYLHEIEMSLATIQKAGRR
jgi:glycosyltransferase involved in cell wall biosynthesis